MSGECQHEGQYTCNDPKKTAYLFSVFLCCAALIRAQREHRASLTLYIADNHRIGRTITRNGRQSQGRKGDWDVQERNTLFSEFTCA